MKRLGKSGNQMVITRLDEDGPLIIQAEPHQDERGFFMREFCHRELVNVQSISFLPVQANTSLSKTKGTVRGLHLQVNEKTESKLVKVAQGKIFDVCVNLNQKSNNFGKVYTVELDDNSGISFHIPRWFAHGFQTLTDNTKVSYLVDNFYDRNAEIGLLWNDIDLKIKWPTEVTEISPKDLRNLTFKEFKKLNYE